MGSNLELIELNSRAREFLSLEVAAHQSGLVATVAESYADAFFHRISATESSNLGFAASIRNGVPAGFHEKQGFIETRELIDDKVVAELAL